MIVEHALPFDDQLSLTMINLSLFKFFMIVDDSFFRLTTRMIVHVSFSLSCFGNHWPYSGQKTCYRPLLLQKIHTFTSLSYRTPFSIHIFMQKELGICCSRDFACGTAGELYYRNYYHLTI